MFKRQIIAALLIGWLSATVNGATIIGPSPYAALLDTPDGVYHDDDIVCIQDFEGADGPWEVGFSFDTGQRIGPNFTSGDGIPVTDSVDADDNSLDGSGVLGASWFTDRSFLNITFDEPTTAASFVFTDADSRAENITISAFDSNGNQLLSRTYASFLDDVFTGTTQEDRFFGVVAMNNELIKRLSISIDAGTGIEVDHVRFTKAIPEPAAFSMLAFGLLGLTVLRRRRA